MYVPWLDDAQKDDQVDNPWLDYGQEKDLDGILELDDSQKDN